MPKVNVMEEMIDMMTASRSFEANVQAFQSLKEMVVRSLDIGR
jgi:flagellar basal-body rod protein FlgC